MIEPVPWDYTCTTKLELMSSGTKLMNIVYVPIDTTCVVGRINNVILRTRVLRVKFSHVFEELLIVSSRNPKKDSSSDNVF